MGTRLARLGDRPLPYRASSHSFPSPCGAQATVEALQVAGEKGRPQARLWPVLHRLRFLSVLEAATCTSFTFLEDCLRLCFSFLSPAPGCPLLPGQVSEHLPGEPDSPSCMALLHAPSPPLSYSRGQVSSVHPKMSFRVGLTNVKDIFSSSLTSSVHPETAHPRHYQFTPKCPLET